MYDHILIEDLILSNETSNKFCGSEIPSVIFSANNLLIIKLLSDDSGARNGFQVEYSSGKLNSLIKFLTF
jgi:hypothetical protein